MIQLTLHTTFPDELRQEWNALLEESVSHVPFLRHEYLQAWWKSRGGGEWPQAQLALVSGRQDGQLVGIAPLFYTPDHQERPSLMLLGSIEISDYLDFIVRPDDLQPFMDALFDFLPGAGLPDWQTLDLYNFLDSSPSLQALQQTANRLGWDYQQADLQHSPYISLPGDWEAYLTSIDKKQRHEIRRKMRRFEAAEVPARWYLAEDKAALDDEIKGFLSLMEQDEEKAAFLTAPMRETLAEIIHCAFDEGCLHLSFLEIEGQKAAAYLSFDYLNRIWVYNSGFDRRFNDYSPGWVLLGYELQWANENKRCQFDFMRGDEEYKYRFGGIDRQVLRATLTRAN